MMAHRDRLPLLALLAAVALAACGAPAASRDDAGQVRDTCSGAVADPEYATAIQAGSTFMERAMAAFEAPGAAVAVAVHGEVVWAAAFGLADTEAGVPACPETAFRVGSVSKSITAAALARLLDAGAIDLDSTVGDLLPDLPRELHSITVAQLGHHQSGIRHYRTSGEVVNRQHFDSVAAGLSIFAGSPLLFEPGTSSSYSSYGYNLLGALLEAVTGDDYGSLVERQVLDVVGMISTTPDDASVQPPARARPYERLAVAQVVPAPVADLSDRLPSGGWSASASDLARLGAALLDDSFISPDAQDALFADAALPDGETTGYGIGFEVACNPPGPCLAMQTGAVVGGSALLLIDRANGVVAAIVMNVGTATATSAPPPAQPPPDPPELLAPFGGAG